MAYRNASIGPHHVWFAGAAARADAYPLEGTSSVWQAVLEFVFQRLVGELRLKNEQAARTDGSNERASGTCQPPV